jgi:hypothetical protein
VTPIPPLTAPTATFRGPWAAPGEDENAADERRAYRDISDELPVFCPECAEREFGEDGYHPDHG